MTKYLNELFFIHQRTLIHASDAIHVDERSRLLRQADDVANEISAIQNAKGADAIELLPAASI